MLKQAIARVLPEGLQRRIQLARATLHRVPGHALYQEAVRGRSGIEIGGPSMVFRTSLPLYQVVGELDGVNFAGETLWEGALRPGRTYDRGGATPGWQFICDATALDGVPSARYDVLLSSNCLEHVANPLKALAEWKRVLKPGGSLVLVLPRKDGNFDHRCPETTVAHLLDDLGRDVGEDDLTHLDEILRLHDLSRDPLAGTPAAFRERSLRNVANRTLHHHVFDQPLMREMLAHAGFRVLHMHTSASDHFALAVDERR